MTGPPDPGEPPGQPPAERRYGEPVEPPPPAPPPPVPAPRRPRLPIAGGVLMEVGGALIVLGSLLAWRKITRTTLPVPQVFRDRGIDGTAGKVSLVAGIVALPLGILVAVARDRATRVGLALVGVVAGVAGAGEALYNMATGKSQAITSAAPALARFSGISVDRARAIILRLFAGGALTYGLQMGIFLVAAGGGVVIVGALMGLAGRRKVAAPPPAFQTGWPPPS